MKAYIVWNEGLNEGVVFLDEKDARDTANRSFRGMYTSLGDNFANECYDDDHLTLQIVEIETPATERT